MSHQQPPGWRPPPQQPPQGYPGQDSHQQPQPYPPQHPHGYPAQQPGYAYQAPAPAPPRGGGSNRLLIAVVVGILLLFTGGALALGGFIYYDAHEAVRRRDAALVGLWSEDPGTERIEFFSDHTVKLEDPKNALGKLGMSGSWAFLEDGRVKADLAMIGVKLMTLTGYVQGETLTLESAGKRYTYRKQRGAR